MNYNREDYQNKPHFPQKSLRVDLEPSQISTNKKPENDLDSKECSWDENTDSQLERLPETGFHRSLLEDRDPCKAEFIEMLTEANGAEPRMFQAWKLMITFCVLLQLFVYYCYFFGGGEEVLELVINNYRM